MDRVGSSVVALVLLAGCGDESEVIVIDREPVAPDAFELLDATVCDADAGPFSRLVDNAYFPLAVGTHHTLEGADGEVVIRIDITVLDEVEVVGGVDTVVMEEAEREDGELVEVSRNFFAQALDGTVCYFGEDVDDYEDGEIVGHGGTWRAGDDGARPGIMSPGHPRAGTRFFQERAPGIAEDVSAILEVGAPFGEFDDVMRARDWNPLEHQMSADGDDKVYARDIGLVFDAGAEIVSMTPIP